MEKLEHEDNPPSDDAIFDAALRELRENIKKAAELLRYLQRQHSRITGQTHIW